MQRTVRTRKHIISDFDIFNTEAIGSYERGLAKTAAAAPFIEILMQ